MTSRVTYIRSSGFIFSVVTGDIYIDIVSGADQATDTIHVDGTVDAQKSYIVEGVVVTRPELDLSVLDKVAHLSLPPLSLPPGTAIIVRGREVGVSDGSPTEIELPYPGNWHLEFRPPFPWMSTSREVVVS